MTFDMDGWGGGEEIVNPCELSLSEDFPRFSSKAVLTMTSDSTRDIVFLYWCGSFCAASNVCFKWPLVQNCKNMQMLSKIRFGNIILYYYIDCWSSSLSQGFW